jgi:hypothetical protein
MAVRKRLAKAQKKRLQLLSNCNNLREYMVRRRTERGRGVGHPFVL